MSVLGFARGGSAERRTAVRRRLAALDLASGPERPRQASLAPPPDRGARLATALAELGPVPGAFGLWLATRLDLLPASDALALAAVPDRATAAPAADVLAAITEELGAASGRLDLDPRPMASRLLWQQHRARGPHGDRLLVRVVRPGLAADRAAGRELLAAVAAALDDGPWADWRAIPWAELVASFDAGLDERLDLGREAASLVAMAAESADFPVLAAPVVHHALCGPRLLIYEEPLAAGPPAPGGERASARRLLLAWLRLALLGSRLPVDAAESDLALLADGRVAFTGGLAPGLPARAKVDLWDWLAAAAVEDPDRCSSLLVTLAEGAAAEPAAERDLRARLRQVVPFRDGAFRDGGRGDTLAEHVFAQVRLAAERGVAPGAPLLTFVRGLAAVAFVARRLAPEADPLAEGFEDLRASVALARVRRAVSPPGLAEAADRYAAALLELPQRLDRALSAEAPSRAPEPGERSAERGRDATALVAALGLALAATVLVTRHLAALGPWVERAGFAAVLLLAAALLAAAGRAA